MAEHAAGDRREPRRPSSRRDPPRRCERRALDDAAQLRARHHRLSSRAVSPSATTDALFQIARTSTVSCSESLLRAGPRHHPRHRPLRQLGDRQPAVPQDPRPAAHHRRDGRGRSRGQPDPSRDSRHASAPTPSKSASRSTRRCRSAAGSPRTTSSRCCRSPLRPRPRAGDDVRSARLVPAHAVPDGPRDRRADPAGCSSSGCGPATSRRSRTRRSTSSAIARATTPSSTRRSASPMHSPRGSRITRSSGTTSTGTGTPRDDAYRRARAWDGAAGSGSTFLATPALARTLAALSLPECPHRPCASRWRPRSARWRPTSTPFSCRSDGTSTSACTRSARTRRRHGPLRSADRRPSSGCSRDDSRCGRSAGAAWVGAMSHVLLDLVVERANPRAVADRRPHGQPAAGRDGRSLARGPADCRRLGHHARAGTKPRRGGDDRHLALRDVPRRQGRPRARAPSPRTASRPDRCGSPDAPMVEATLGPADRVARVRSHADGRLRHWLATRRIHGSRGSSCHGPPTVDGPTITASRSLSVVRNFLHGPSTSRSRRRVAQPDGREWVLWSDIRFCWNPDAPGRAARRADRRRRRGEAVVRAVVWRGVRPAAVRRFNRSSRSDGSCRRGA